MRKMRILCVALAIVLLVTACAKEAPSGEISDDAPIEVWIDAAREEAAGTFVENYPDKGELVTLTTTDYGQLPQKILFWNNVGGGWPDASFAGPQIVPLINDAAHSYLGDLKPFVDEDIIEGFAPGSLENCWDEGKLYCLRNDLAFFVLYYNAPLLEELGLTIPETYEEMKDMGAQFVRDHPDIQFAVAPESVFHRQALVSAKCPFQQIVGPGQIRINATHENCVMASQWLDDMVANGSLLMTDMWSEEVSTMMREGRWLFLPSSSWFGDYVINGTYFEAGDPAAQGLVGVSAMPKWQGQDHAWTYWWGGAAWVMSRHTENPQLVADFLTYMTTDVIKVQGTYPAYMPAAEEWLQSMPDKTYYNDPVAVGELFKAEAAYMWTKATESPVDVGAIWGPIQAKINSGEIGSYTEALEEFQAALLGDASKLGYEAVTTGLDDF